MECRIASRVLFIGLDAADSGLIAGWRAELPTLAHLEATGARGALVNPAPLLPGSIWPMLNTGEHPRRSGLFHHPAQIRTGEAEARPIRDRDLDGARDFWSVAADSGLDVTAIDPVQATLRTGPMAGSQLVDWGTHDALGLPRSHPPGLIDTVAARFGPYPIAQCDNHDRSDTGYLHLVEGLVTGADRKADVITHLLDREARGLACAVFTEAHCAGHQLWHFGDPDHPWYSAAAPARLQSSMLEVYRALDRGLGRVIEHVGPETLVVVVASHGIGPFRRAAALLTDVLERLAYGSGKATRLRVGAALPRSVKRAIRRFVNQGSLNRLQLGTSSRVLRFDGRRTRALAVGNGSVGAIRLNLIGREPQGCVQPGREAEAILEDLSAAVNGLRDPATGEAITRQILTAADAFGSDHHPDLPDLVIEFRADLGTLEAFESARLGRFGPPVPTVRSGDHRLQGRWWFTGPMVRPGEVPDADILDVAPTILDLVGLAAPNWMEGTSRAPTVLGRQAPEA